jgi:hypothetical protein
MGLARSDGMAARRIDRKLPWPHRIAEDAFVPEQSAAYVLDTHDLVDSFAKNSGLGIPLCPLCAVW